MQLAHNLLIAIGCLLILGGVVKMILVATRYARWASTAEALRARGIDPATVLQAAAVATRRRVEARLGDQGDAIPSMEAAYTPELRSAMGRIIAPLNLRSGLATIVAGVLTLLVGTIGVESLLEQVEGLLG